MKQKTGKLTVITVLLLTVCIAAGAMGLPRLLGESFSIPEAAEPALSGTALWVGMDELPPHDLRYDRADEFMEVCHKLWNSWEPGALLMDMQNSITVNSPAV